jgi:hypothetical protein
MTLPKTPFVVKRWITDRSGPATDEPMTRLRRLCRHWAPTPARESAADDRTGHGDCEPSSNRDPGRADQRAAAREFLELVDWMLGDDSIACSQVLRDPLVGWWLQTAEQLANPHAGQRLLDAGTCRRHLHRFKAIALAVAAAAGRDLQLTTPLTEQLPLVVIGTPWSLAATGDRPPAVVQLLGISDGILTVAVEGRTARVPLSENTTTDQDESLSRLGLRRHRASLARAEGCRIWLQPHAFHWPVVAADDAPAWSRTYTCFSEHKSGEPAVLGRATFEQALATLARFHPRTLLSLRDRVRLAAPLLAADTQAFEPPADDSPELAELTLNSLPGTLVVKSFDHPLLLAERMVRQLAFERAANRSTSSLEADISVCRFWLEAVLSDELKPETRGYAIDRLRRIPRQLSQALRGQSPPTTPNHLRPVVQNNVNDQVAALQRSIAWLCLPADPPAWEFRGGQFVQQPSGFIRRAA